MPVWRSRDVAILLVALTTGSAQLAAQTFRTKDPVIHGIWEEGMERSQTERLAQVLTDSIGPRLSGTPNFQSAVDWLLQTYAEWAVDARREEYGTWRGWQQGILHVDLIEPRVQTLEAKLLAWSPGTDGSVAADLVAIPDFGSRDDAATWLPVVRGKFVLASAPEITCREPQALRELAREETVERMHAERTATRQSWQQRLEMLGGFRDSHGRLERAGALGIITSRWSDGWGVNKIFNAFTETAVSIDLSCEDYGMLYRMATNNQGPRLRIEAEASDRGTVPMFNVIAELTGAELPEEFVMLSAHLDSWHGATGTTDNGTGTITMLEAMRILKRTYPRPRRTILVGHWGGEEQGLIGSRAFTEDHPDVVENLQVLFNQDNGTWRVEYIQTQGLYQASGNVARWIAEIPTEISQHIRLDLPGPQELGGSDHVSFLCHGAPGFRLQSHYPDYRQYTWHTNLDTYDKIIFDDLKNNATLAAMLAYLASEDPERVPRDRALLPIGKRTGEERSWVACQPARRNWE
jgi:hypothetical protein